MLSKRPLCNVDCVKCNVKNLLHITHLTLHKYKLFATFLAGFCLTITSTVMATPNYDKTVDQLSQAVTTYKELTGHPEKYDVAFRRDPTKPLVDGQGNILSASGMKDGLSVQGIIWSDANPLAVIEGDLYAPGDTIDQYTIAEIRKDGVTVQSGTTTQFIPLDRGLESGPPTATP